MQLLLGDSYITLKTLPDESVQTCITSPPYYGLRDFGVDGQLGLENTPEKHIARMVEVFREVRWVLKNDGTLWLNLGDTYAGGGRGGDPKHSKGDNSAQATAPSYKGIPAKNLLGMPWRVAFALQADGWYLRQDIIWHKPNVMPENVRDRCTKAHEYIFLLSKSAHYYFDADAIREPHEDKRELPRRSSGNTGNSTRNRGTRKWSKGIDPLVRPHMIKKNGIHYNPRGRGKRSVWTVASQPFKGAHFATYPPELIRPCTLAGAPTQHTVLDPFMGSGTTGYVALSLQRNFIGIELNPEYIALAKERIGVLGLSSTEHEAPATTQQGKVA